MPYDPQYGWFDPADEDRSYPGDLYAVPDHIQQLMNDNPDRNPWPPTDPRYESWALAYELRHEPPPRLTWRGRLWVFQTHISRGQRNLRWGLQGRWHRLRRRIWPRPDDAPPF